MENLQKILDIKWCLILRQKIQDELQSRKWKKIVNCIPSKDEWLKAQNHKYLLNIRWFIASKENIFYLSLNCG